MGLSLKFIRKRFIVFGYLCRFFAGAGQVQEKGKADSHYSKMDSSEQNGIGLQCGLDRFKYHDGIQITTD